MQTRVPAWCDRVLLSPTAKMLVQDVRNIIYIFSKRVSFRQIVFYATRLLSFFRYHRRMPWNME